MKLSVQYRVVLIALLSIVVLNLTTGFIAYRYLGKIDADYSEALKSAVKSQNMLRTVSAQTARTLANTMLFINKETQSEDMRKAIKEAGEIAGAIYEIMGNEPSLSPEMKNDFDLLRQKRTKWRSALAEDLDMVKTGNDEQVSTTLQNNSLPLLIEYLDSLDRYCAANQSAYSTINQNLTQQTTSSQHLLFGMSALPFMLLFVMPSLVILLLIMLVFIIEYFNYR
jgi:hypothetical protein